ncbi:hypothetical protein AA106555_2035 [Neokomagataea thailandica NBRC 106555]|uniref:Transposase n=1 Tax=Neokomagataea thailandica NBRC 106555 TaxID=1223520 RepID=A0ABQ0QSN3_9PROT|nr:hypothetical protein AA106555_2035 [Neokomagataea thailandica NBRC 106555]
MWLFQRIWGAQWTMRCLTRVKPRQWGRFLWGQLFWMRGDVFYQLRAMKLKRGTMRLPMLSCWRCAERHNV